MNTSAAATSSTEAHGDLAWRVTTYAVVGTGESGACVMEGDDTIADCYGAEGGRNAILVAAAPAMLAALIQIQRTGYTDFGDRLMVEAAIAQATGAA